MVIENVFSPTPVSVPEPAPEPVPLPTSGTAPEPESLTAPPEPVTAFRESLTRKGPALDPQDVIESWGLSWHLGCALVNMFYGDLAAAARHLERERRRLE